MQREQLSRLDALYGSEAVDRLRRSRVAVFGLGGVGSYTAEALARSGIGTLDLIDGDTVQLSNLNRQLCALRSTVGRAKAEVMKERMADINPEATVNARTLFFDESTAAQFTFEDYDYVIDAIDSVSSKLLLAECCRAAGTPLIACMGAGNKLDPSRLEIADISKTSYDPLAKVMRRELKKRGITHLTVVYSKEPPAQPKLALSDGKRRSTPASNAFVPGTAGLLLAAKVINELTGNPI